MTIEEEFGAGLRSMREKEGISLCKLADITGINKSQLSYIERGMSSPTLKRMETLKNAFGYGNLGVFLSSVLGR